MSKKKSRKKHQFKYAEPQSAVVADRSMAESGTHGPQVQPATRKQLSGSALAGVDNFDYVAKDIRRVAVLAVGFVSIQIVLWYVFGHTSLGSQVYGLVKL